MPILPIFACFYPVLAFRATDSRNKTSKRENSGDALFQPEKHCFPRRNHGLNRGIQRIHHRRGQPEMTNQRGGKILFQRRRGRQRGAQSPLPALDQIERRMFAGKPLRRAGECVAFKFHRRPCGRRAFAGAFEIPCGDRAANGGLRPVALSPAYKLRRRSQPPWR